MPPVHKPKAFEANADQRWSRSLSVLQGIKMLEQKVYTPRESFDVQRQPAGFLTLPPELRIAIYEYAFATIVPTPLLIRKYLGRPWLYRRPMLQERIPALLLLNKQIYLEARDVLHSVCFATADQVISIEHVQPILTLHPPPPPRDFNNICAYRSVREIAPMLRSLPRIRLEVQVDGIAFTKRASSTIVLLRWIRAVLNSRPSLGSLSHVHLRSFDVIFRMPDIYPESQGEGLVKAVMGVRSVAEETEVRFSSSVAAGPVKSERIRVKVGRKLEIVNVPGGDLEGETSTWKALETSYRETDVRANKKRLYVLAQFSGETGWSKFVDGMSRTLLGR